MAPTPHGRERRYDAGILNKKVKEKSARAILKNVFLKTILPVIIISSVLGALSVPSVGVAVGYSGFGIAGVKSVQRMGNLSRSGRSDAQQSFYEDWTDEDFEGAMRLDKTNFQKLVYVIAPYMPMDDLAIRMAWVSSDGGPVSVEAALAYTLRHLAGGSVHDVRRLFGKVGKSTYYKIVEHVIAILDDSLKLRFPMEDEAELEKIAAGFRRRWRGVSPFRDTVGALDGIIIQILRPDTRGRFKCANSQSFFTRKMVFAYNVQAMCDSDYRFTFCDVQCPGSAHDSTAFAMSPLGHLLHHLPYPYYILGDEAYGTDNQLLTPISGRNLSPEQDAYNYFQSSGRIHIEQAFGQLTSRWGILWRPIRHKWTFVPKVVSVLLKLHNLCVDQRLERSARIEPLRNLEGTLRREHYGVGMMLQCFEIIHSSIT